ncbi:MAG TPA: VOC family protein [Solirubrobacteraceae bacterium]|jgi:catechol 2,3-dioxygenase-like lactoylglutathione lyase family enzyme
MSTQTPIVTGVDFVSIPITDYAAALEFYVDVLGLTPSTEYDRIPGAEFQVGNLTLQIIDAAAIGRSLTPHAFPIALQVQDMTSARAELASRGVTFTHEFDSGVCHNAAFNDPDGNTFLLHQRYAPRAQDG